MSFLTSRVASGGTKRGQVNKRRSIRTQKENEKKHRYYRGRLQRRALRGGQRPTRIISSCYAPDDRTEFFHKWNKYINLILDTRVDFRRHGLFSEVVMNDVNMHIENCRHNIDEFLTGQTTDHGIRFMRAFLTFMASIALTNVTENTIVRLDDSWLKYDVNLRFNKPVAIPVEPVLAQCVIVVKDWRPDSGTTETDPATGVVPLTEDNIKARRNGDMIDVVLIPEGYSGARPISLKMDWLGPFNECRFVNGNPLWGYLLGYDDEAMTTDFHRSPTTPRPPGDRHDFRNFCITWSPYLYLLEETKLQSCGIKMDNLALQSLHSAIDWRRNVFQSIESSTTRSKGQKYIQDRFMFYLHTIEITSWTKGITLDIMTDDFAMHLDYADSSRVRLTRPFRLLSVSVAYEDTNSRAFVTAYAIEGIENDKVVVRASTERGPDVIVTVRWLGPYRNLSSTYEPWEAVMPKSTPPTLGQEAAARHEPVPVGFHEQKVHPFLPPQESSSVQQPQMIPLTPVTMVPVGQVTLVGQVMPGELMQIMPMNLTQIALVQITPVGQMSENSPPPKNSNVGI